MTGFIVALEIWVIILLYLFVYLLPFLFLCLAFSKETQMKKIVYSIVFLSVFILVSCSNKEQKQDNGKQAFQLDSVSEAGVRRMQVSNSGTDVRFKGKDYHISIRRAPGDSLPRVKDQAGDVYVDNEILLRITRDKGSEVYSGTFTKRSFSSLVDDNFLSKSILEGMVFDKTSDEGIVLAASVSFPQTDLYVPLSITVTPEGKISMVKEEVMDENYQEEKE